MAEVTRANGLIDVLTNNLQKPVEFYKIAITGLEPGISDAAGDDTAMAGDRGPNGAVEKVMGAIQKRSNILLAQVDTDQLSVAVAYADHSADYNGDSSETTYAAQLQADIRAIGDVTSADGSTTIALSGATVTDNGFKLA